MQSILIISGTNRKDAVSPTVAKLYAAMLQDVGVSSEIIDLQDLPNDFLVSALYENSGKNTKFNIMREKMKAAEKFVFILPEYNGSFPGVLKAFIDGLDFPDTFTDKKCALVGVSAGMLGSSHAMSHLTDILNYCGTHVLARKPRLTEIAKYLNGNKLNNAWYNELLELQIEELIKF